MSNLERSLSRKLTENELAELPATIVAEERGETTVLIGERLLVNKWADAFEKGVTPDDDDDDVDVDDTDDDDDEDDD